MCIHMCVYIYIYLCMCIYIYIYIHTYIHMFNDCLELLVEDLVVSSLYVLCHDSPDTGVCYVEPHYNFMDLISIVCTSM